MRFGDTATRTLLAVLSQQRPTVRSVADEVGVAYSRTHACLRKLRAAGLVEWDAGKQATLRPMVVPVRTPVRYDAATAHRSGAGDALVAHPGSVSGPSPDQRRAAVPDSTRTLSVLRGDA